jgi:hypothetical protein
LNRGSIGISSAFNDIDKKRMAREKDEIYEESPIAPPYFLEELTHEIYAEFHSKLVRALICNPVPAM